MSVFTTVSPEQLVPWLKHYAVGDLLDLAGIASGIENTNYFVTTTQGRFVLTLFEKLTAAELPFYLELMDHLARHGVPCPAPMLSLDDRLFGELNDKPASLVTRLAGKSVMAPGVAECHAIGAVLAEMHLAGKTYPRQMPNPRGEAWCAATAADMAQFVDDERKAVMQEAVARLTTEPRQDLPSGVIHADLFRDNVLFDGTRVGGLIDFYFACNDAWLYDVAITVNDWCVTDDGDIDPARCRALLLAYQAVRPFTEAERLAWSGQLQAAALRFWLSRLFDFHRPRAGELTHAKDPEHFYRVLCRHRQRAIGDLWL